VQQGGTAVGGRWVHGRSSFRTGTRAYHSLRWLGDAIALGHIPSALFGDF
jgi:hypothetical protein